MNQYVMGKKLPLMLNASMTTNPIGMNKKKRSSSSLMSSLHHVNCTESDIDVYDATLVKMLAVVFQS